MPALSRESGNTWRLPTVAELRAVFDPSCTRAELDRSPFGIYVVDADFRLVQVSDGAQKVFSNVRPLIGRDVAEVLRLLWPEPLATEIIERLWHTLATGEPHPPWRTTAMLRPRTPSRDGYEGASATNSDRFQP